MVVSSDYKEQVNVLHGVFSHKNAKATLNKNEEKLAFTLGNRKVGPGTLIFNMTPVSKCPSARLGLCDMAPKHFGGNGECYAYFAEYYYPQALPYRSIQALQWKNWSASKIADEMFTEIVKSQNRKNPIRFIRFNEGGDFISVSCVLKAGKIAKYLGNLCKMANIPVVRLYTYTHRKDLFEGMLGKALLNSLPKNFTINGSNFKLHNEFRVLDISRSERDAKDENGKKVNKFTCVDDCSKCNLCKFRNGEGISIIQAKH